MFIDILKGHTGKVFNRAEFVHQHTQKYAVNHMECVEIISISDVWVFAVNLM